MVFLIDFENVGNGGFDGIEELGCEDKVIIFYSEKAQSLAMDTHLRLERSAVQKEYICVDVGGKNALDFQLSTYLGYLIANQDETEYSIVSKDEGYSFVTTFWEKRDRQINRCVNLRMESKQRVAENLEGILGEYQEDIKEVSEIIMKYKTKQGINNALVKTYGSEKSGKIYKKIRPLIQEKKGR